MIGLLAQQLMPAAPYTEFDIIVVANGCKDDTADVAASFGPSVRVLSIPVASKFAAFAAADRVAGDFPRIYVDADVELSITDVRALTAALRVPGVRAVAPERVLDLAARPWTVRWYYAVWTRLPEVRRGLWGRGVIAVNEGGQRRMAGLPPLLLDDLAAALLFAPHERAVVHGARVIIHTPRTVADLLRRRVRSATGMAQLEQADAPEPTARTRMSDLIEIVRHEPRMVLPVAFFLSVAVLARLRARRAVARGDFATWCRDESSRRSPAVDGVIVGHSAVRR